MNWFECQFTALRSFTLDGSDYPSYADQEPPSPATSAGATSAPSPKGTFAVDSKIRRPDPYPTFA